MSFTALSVIEGGTTFLPGYRAGPGFRLHSKQLREECPCLVLVVPIGIPKFLYEMLLLHWNDKPSKGDQPDAAVKQEEPITGNDAKREKHQQRRSVERMPDPTVRTGSNHLMILLGQDRLRNISPDGAEDPKGKGDSEQSCTDRHPAYPQWDGESRPRQ